MNRAMAMQKVKRRGANHCKCVLTEFVGVQYAMIQIHCPTDRSGTWLLHQLEWLSGFLKIIYIIAGRVSEADL